MRYVSLHTHTTFSYGDGYGPVNTHVKRIADLGMNAVGFTEHGNTSSHVQLEKAARELGIQPIFGVEAYCAAPDQQRKFHQILLAMNEEGLRNLNRIVTQSYKDFFYFPTVHSATLQKYSEGLIVTSGCSDSLLSCTLLGGKSLGEKRLAYTDEDFQRAIDVIKWYQSIFGDRYYLEVQRFPGLDRTCVLNPAFAKLSKITGAKLVATSDVHYPLPTDNEMQKILHAASRNTGTVAAAEASWEYDILLTYPLSDKEIAKDLMATGLDFVEAWSAIMNTERIARRCNVELPKNEPIKWKYDTTKFESIEEYTWAELRKGWEFRFLHNKFMQKDPDKYKDRIFYEMERIVPRGFCDYFAMLSYLVVWAKEHKIAVGPARGSAAASLVCYLLRITEVDPLQHPHMMFERFIDPKRLDLPDVDLDFADDRRDEVRMEAIRVFGQAHVGNIINFTRYKGKNSIDSVARVYQIPKWAAEKVKDLIIERSGGDSRASDTLADTFDTFEQAREVLEKYPDLRQATRLEGNYQGVGVHAAGLVISNAPISDTCALYTREREGGKIVTTIAYDKKDAEYLGMLKADFLGLSTMGMIGIALEIIGMDLEELYRVPLDEARTLRAFKENDVTGIFQFEGRATRLVCGDVSPDNFQHLADINALSRPGPLFSGMTAQYVEVRHGRAAAEELHPIVDEQTSWTYGQIVYQEQVLTIIRDLGGFPVQRVGDIRKIISQKLGEASFQEMWQEFRDGAARLHGVDEQLALKIWRFMVTSATYSFNIAHCVSYSMLAFWQQWIKQHHPTAFYAAQLTKVGDGKEQLVKRGKLMQDALRHGQQISPPDLELSGKGWTADPASNRVVAGLLQVQGIGPKTANNIIEWRKSFGEPEPDDEPLHWEDLLEIKGIGEKTIKRIVEFCDKDDPFDLALVGNILRSYRRLIANGGSGWYGIPHPTHLSGEIPKIANHVVWMGIPRKKNYQDYVENQRTRTGREIDEIIANMKDPHLVKSCVVQCYDDDTEDVYVRFNRWTFPKFEAALEDLKVDNDIVIVTGRKRDDFGVSIHVQDIIIIDPTEDLEDDDA